MCRLENRRFRIFIDRDDRLRVIHAGSKLDRTGHAAGDDEFWADRTATQTDLALGIQPSGFHHRTGAGKLTSQQICQFFQHFQIFRLLHASSGYHQDVSIFDKGFLRLFYDIQNPHVGK